MHRNVLDYKSLCALCRFRVEEESLRTARAEREAKRHTDDLLSSASDEGVLLKDTSADELELPALTRSYSEEYDLATIFIVFYAIY